MERRCTSRAHQSALARVVMGDRREDALRPKRGMSTFSFLMLPAAVASVVRNGFLR
jgi:hypothetical protein